MFTTLSLLSFLFIGCGEETPKEEVQTEEQKKAEAVEEAKKQLEDEAKKKQEDEAKKEQEKEALKTEIKKELEDEAKKEQESKKATQTKKQTPAERSFTVRVSVDKKPMGTRPKRIDAEAKKKLSAVAKKAGYSTMVGNLSYKESKADCSKGNKCIRTATATFKK